MSKSNSMAPQASKILFQLSGSIACFKACAVLSKLAQAGHEIEVVASPSALKFVGEATLEGLTGRKVHTATFESGGYMDHIHLVRWADLILLCPATANTLNKFAAGVGDDLISTMFLAHDFAKPYLIAPAMNQFMWSHPATQASITKLQSWGLSILGTSSGALACGEVGSGRMLEPDQILSAISTALNSRNQSALADKKILITSGGTAEPIDGVRAITNTSSGRTGSELALWFGSKGANVTLLHAKTAVIPQKLEHIAQISESVPASNITLQPYTSFTDLQSKLTELLKSESYDVVIHLAAVADYSVAQVESNGAIHQAPLREKIDSGEELTLRLKKNPKLVDSIRSLSKNKSVKVVAFKLTSTDSEETRLSAVDSLAQNSQADFIVQNEASQISAVSHPFRIFKLADLEGGEPANSLSAHEMTSVSLVASANGAKALAEKLNDLLYAVGKRTHDARVIEDLL